MKKILLIMMVFGSFGAFADDSLFINSDNPKPWVESNESTPKIEVESKVYLGDRMILQRFGFYEECLESKINFSKSKVGYDYVIKNGGVMCKKIPDKKYIYHPEWQNTMGPNPMPIHLKVGKKINLKMNGWSIKKFSRDEFRESFQPVVRYVTKVNSLQRSIEYAGKNGNLLKFIYSEFKDNLARDAFTREFQIDLNEGSTGAYKGAVFEILNADNASVTYKIIRHFPII
jgi:hypothetical protein